MTVTTWQIPGSDGEAILGNTHPAEGEPRGVVVIAHGFKGYKDYGMFPAIAARVAAAGCIAHRFNFSHSGMTEQTEVFERPDLFERDTWSRQVTDVRAVRDAITAGALEGGGLPLVLLGHSRGGVAVLLTVGRDAGVAGRPAPAGVVTLAAPSYCNPFTTEVASQLLEQGWIESPSSRTGQDLRVGADFLREQLDDPDGHDVLALVGRITCPLLVIHGDADPTVAPECAEQIAAAHAGPNQVLLVESGDHVFDTPNPFPADGEPSPQLATVLEAVAAFLDPADG